MATLCGPCGQGDHDACEPVPAAVDGLGLAVEAAGFTDCRCLHGDRVLESIANARAAYERGERPAARVCLRNALALLEAQDRPGAKVIELRGRIRRLAEAFGKPEDEVERVVAEAEELLGIDDGRRGA